MRHAFQRNQFRLHPPGCKLLHRSLGKPVILGGIEATASEQDDDSVIPTETRARAIPTRANEAIQIDTIGDDLRSLPKRARQPLDHRCGLDDDRGCGKPRQAAGHGANPRPRSARA